MAQEPGKIIENHDSLNITVRSSRYICCVELIYIYCNALISMPYKDRFIFR